MIVFFHCQFKHVLGVQMNHLAEMSKMVLLITSNTCFGFEKSKNQFSITHSFLEAWDPDFMFTKLGVCTVFTYC